MTVPEQNSNLYGSDTINGSGAGPNVSTGISGGVENGNIGTGTGGSGTNAAGAGNAGGSCAKPGVAEPTGPSWCKPFGNQQVRPNVIKRPPVILRRVMAGQAATAGVDKILRCLDRQQQNQSPSQGPAPCAPRCLPPPPRCCFPPPGCFPPPPGCCFPPPGCFAPPPGCCFPPPGCFPPPPGCGPHPCLGFPTPICFPRSPGLPQQNHSRSSNSSGSNAAGPGSDSPYFNNCNFYMSEPGLPDSSSMPPQQCPLPGAPGFPMNPYPTPIPQGSCNREGQRVSLLSNCKSGGPNKVNSDCDCAKSLNGNFPSEFLYSNGDTTSYCMSSRNPRRNRYRKGDFCSCKECVEKLIEKEVSRRLKKLNKQSGSYSVTSKNLSNEMKTSSTLTKYSNSGSSARNSNSSFLSEKNTSSRNSEKNSSTLSSASTKGHKMLPSAVTSSVVKTFASGSITSDLSGFESSERKIIKTTETNIKQSNRSRRNSKMCKSSMSSGSSSVKSQNLRLTQEIRAAASSTFGSRTVNSKQPSTTRETSISTESITTTAADVAPNEASRHHSQREHSCPHITVEVKVDEATTTKVVRPSSLLNASRSAPCLPVKEKKKDTTRTGVIGSLSQHNTSLVATATRTPQLDQMDEATSAYGVPSNSVPYSSALTKMDDATGTFGMFPSPVNNKAIRRNAPPAITSTWDKVHTSSASNKPHTSQGLNQSHSTITRIVVTPSSNSCVRTKHVTVYKQRVHRNDDQAPHVYPTVYRKGAKRKLHP